MIYYKKLAIARSSIIFIGKIVKCRVHQHNTTLQNSLTDANFAKFTTQSRWYTINNPSKVSQITEVPKKAPSLNAGHKIPYILFSSDDYTATQSSICS